MVNLLPVYPLDGGQIAREILLRLNLRDGIRQSLLLSIVAAVGMAALAASRELYFAALLFGYLAYSSYIRSCKPTAVAIRGSGRALRVSRSVVRISCAKSTRNLQSGLVMIFKNGKTYSWRA